MNEVEANVRLIYCDHCGSKVRAVPVDWFTLDSVLCPTCHAVDEDHPRR